MAIDTRDKRSSATGGMPWDWGDGWVPDGVWTQADRQDATETYRGIPAYTPTAGRRVFGGWLLWIVLGIALCLVLIF